MIFDPQQLDPLMALGGTPERFLTLREDASALAAALEADLEFLVTDTLTDFQRWRSRRFETSIPWRKDGRERRLFCLRRKKPVGGCYWIVRLACFVGLLEKRVGLTPRLLYDAVGAAAP